VLLRGRTKGGYDVDLTADATLRSSDEKVALVDSLGWIQPVSNGHAVITLQAGDRTATMEVTVQLPDQPAGPSFRQDVMPVLSKAGCNAGACHGYSLGKNGFKLSLRGADPEKDYLALTDEFAERRINRNNPDASRQHLSGESRHPAACAPPIPTGGEIQRWHGARCLPHGHFQCEHRTRGESG
jgi:hypothetical protein